jgi:lactoylglutathione lyase
MMFTQAVTALLVRDLDESIRFYRHVLGFSVIHRLEREIVHLSTAGMILALRQRDLAVPLHESPHVHIGLTVADLDEAFEELQARGVQFLGEPVDAGVARLAFFNDPDGTPLYLCQWMYWRDTSEVRRHEYDLAAL